MHVQVLGSGCAKCNELYDHACQAAERFGEAAPVVEKVNDVDTFVRLGVRTTPALALDEEVVSMGKVLSVDEIARLIEERSGDGA